MNKDFAKIPENAESKAVDREKEEYPVQQVAVTYPIGEKEVKDAVKELNPDTDSLCLLYTSDAADENWKLATDVIFNSPF